jgi:WXG100 family type VII secretion target
MGERYTFDEEQMTSLKTQFTNEANTVATLRGHLDSAVNQVIGSGYTGPAANRFRDAWESQFKNALTQLESALTDAANEIQNRLTAGSQAGG